MMGRLSTMAMLQEVLTF